MLLSAGVPPQASSTGPALAFPTVTTPQGPKLPLVPTPTPRPTAVPATPTAVAPRCDTTQSPLYCVYTIQPGDSLSEIAEKFGLSSNEDVTASQLLVQSNRPDIVNDKDVLQIAQKLRIPTSAAAAATLAAPSTSQSSRPTGGNALIHTVLKDETVSDIASQYDVPINDIVRVNGLANPDALSIGKELSIPNPKQLAKPAPLAPPIASASTAQTITGPRSNAGLIWPAAGRISSPFGPSHPLGIDIDLYGNANAPIGAAKAGTVSFAGGNACCSYGLYVVVDHGDGLQTLYAHLSKVNVSVGQKVSQGTVVGLGGRTGYATGNHLHFEVHVNGNVVNPMNYLP